MMHTLLPDLAHDRQAGLVDDARRHRVMPRSARAGARHATALVLARISRLSAAGVRRLDARIADDLARRLVPCDGI
jgi:hypothetical protein